MAEEMLERKRRSRCDERKLITEFHRNASHADGLQYTCKPCAIFIVMRSQARHPETVQKARRRDYRSLSQQARNRRKYARRKQAPLNDFTAEEWEAMKRLYHYRCVYCRTKPKELCQDHIMPLSKGGAHTKGNIVPACRRCNTKKHDKAILCPIQPMLLLPVGA
jgi:5-methylcytosine-specific restriction endonuclease McrA